MRPPLRADLAASQPHSAFLLLCATTSHLAGNLLDCFTAQKQDEGLLSCQCRWSCCQSFCQWQMVEVVKGKWKNYFQHVYPLQWSQRENPLTEEVTFPVRPGATCFKGNEILFTEMLSLTRLLV